MLLVEEERYRMMQFLTFAGVIVCFMATIPEFCYSSAVRNGKPDILKDWEIYNPDDLRSRLEDYDRLMTAGTPVRCNLAVKFTPTDGRPLSSHVQEMDRYLKAMLVGTLRAFNRNPQSTNNWESVMSTMLNNPLLEEEERYRVHREERKEIEMKSSTEIDADKMRLWYFNFLNDFDVFSDTTTTVSKLADMNVYTRAKARLEASGVNSFVTLFRRDETVETEVIDLGIIRFPDANHPYIKIYRIQVRVWSDATRILFFRRMRHGLYAIFDSARFKPREAVMRRISSTVMDQAVAVANELLGL
jgi:hypothetical protein